MEFESITVVKLQSIISRIKPILTWVHSESMTDEERTNNPSHITIGGYLKERDIKYCWKKSWNNSLNNEQKEFIKSLPNFDAEIFEEITGVDISKGKQDL